MNWNIVKKILDKGSWSKKNKNHALVIKNVKDKKNEENPNNPYELTVESLGTLVVDKGQIINYKHPKILKSGGLPKPPKFFIFK